MICEKVLLVDGKLVLLVLGGLVILILVEKLLVVFGVDYVIVGEGEVVFLVLFKSIVEKLLLV